MFIVVTAASLISGDHATSHSAPISSQTPILARASTPIRCRGVRLLARLKFYLCEIRCQANGKAKASGSASQLSVSTSISMSKHSTTSYDFQTLLSCIPVTPVYFNSAPFLSISFSLSEAETFYFPQRSPVSTLKKNTMNLKFAIKFKKKSKNGIRILGA